MRPNARTYQDALIFTPLPQGHHVADDGLGDGHQPAATNTREASEDD